jgi:hypothetical protein
MTLGGSSKNITGYSYLPNGMIVQWGRQYVGNNVRSTVTLPIAFTTTASVAASSNLDSVNNWASTGGYYIDTGHIGLWSANFNAEVNWIAIGY